MTIGKLKTYFEKKFVESYQNEKEFKKVLKEFNEKVLKNKSVSRIYNLYDELTTPQGLKESESLDYINEGLRIINNEIRKQKLPSVSKEINENFYEEIDMLIYNNNLALSEIVKLKKEVSKVLSTKKPQIKESIKIPVSSMVKIANQTLKNFIETLDENSKKELFDVLKEDKKSLEILFNETKENAVSKLLSLKENEKDNTTITRIEETINKIKTEEFSQLNYFKIKKLNETI
jgi:hypothetical protein